MVNDCWILGKNVQLVLYEESVDCLVVFVTVNDNYYFTFVSFYNN